MKTTSTRARAATTSPQAQDMQQQMLDGTKQQLALATDAASILFRGVEAIRKIQLQAASHASQRHELVARQLHGQCSPSEIMNLQTQLLDFDMKGASQYWQEVGAAMLKTQVEMMGCASHLVDGAPDAAYKPALAAWQAAVAGAGGAGR